MGYWTGRPASKDNLRLFEPPKAWRRYADGREASTGAVTEKGCSRALDGFLMNSLNATNLVLLTGAGSSFCVQNAATSGLEFVDAPGLSDLWESVKVAAGASEFDAIIDIIPGGARITDVEKLLTQCKLFVALYGEDGEAGREVTTFIKKAEAAILQRVDFIDHETDLGPHQMLLRKVARRGVRKPRAKLFTTNYDLAFEYASRRQGFIVIDGFSHAALPVYDRSHFDLDIVRRDGARDSPDYLDSVFHLYKLHGSIDWRRNSTEIIRSRGDEGLPVLIFPRDSKYQEAFELPFLDMVAALQRALREPDTALLVAGFSFNDRHIAQLVLTALESNMSLRMIVCDPALIEEELIDGDPVMVAADLVSKNSFYHRLLLLAQAGDERLVLIHGRFEDLAVALPDLVAETERERHAMRMRVLREADAVSGVPKT